MRFSYKLTIFSIILFSVAPAIAHDALPLGDGKFSAVPKAGYIFSCQQSFNGGGAFRDGPWIEGDVWYPDRKINVQGDIPWPSANIVVGAEKGGIRLIRGNGLPGHNTGQFPVEQNDPAFQYDRNPNSIQEHEILLELPLDPVFAAQPTCVGMGMIGMTLTGVPIFNGFDAGGRDAVAHEIQDKCNGHPQQQGEYHYHGYSPCMIEEGKGADGSSGLIGYALDGFGIYGPEGPGGREITNADLDECHGRTSPVMWDGKLQSIYHYQLTYEYPYSIGCYRGTPIRQQLTSHLDPNAQENANPGADHRIILEQASRTLNVDPQLLRQAVGPPPPDFARASQLLGIPEDKIRAAFGAP